MPSKNASTNLTAEQQRVASFGIRDGQIVHRKPLMVSAGAGTGKTETIAAFYARRVELGIEPRRILALAFNNKAAGNLHDRISGHLGEATRARSAVPFCTTFHAAGLRFTKRFAGQLGLKSNFTVLGRDDQLQLISEFIHPSPTGWIDPKTCLQILSFVNGSLRTLESVIAERWPHLYLRRHDLSLCYQRYGAAKRDMDVIDFDDMLIFWNKLLADHNVRHRLRKEFDYIIVDEYQDTNPLQERILHRMTRNDAGLVAVGDDLQSICNYRGVEPGAVERLARTSTCLHLTRNFRSTQPLLDACNAVADVPEQNAAPLWSKMKRGPQPELLEVRSDFEQARVVADRVERTIVTGSPLSGLAILARTADELLTIGKELRRRTICYRLHGGDEWIKAPEIVRVIDLLHWIENPANRLAAVRATRASFGRGAGSKSSLDVVGAETLISKRPAGISNKEWLEFEVLTEKLSVASWREQIDLLASCDSDKMNDGSRRNRRKFISLARSYTSRSAFLDHISLNDEEDEAIEKDDNCITLSTIHSAKGKEWQTVFVLNAVDGCLPIQLAESPEAISEERRVLYVGMTRARRSLTLVVPKRLKRCGQTRVHLARSRFLPARALHLYSLISSQRDKQPSGTDTSVFREEAFPQ